MRPTGSKPAQIYGLSKVHKDDTPLRPIVSIPGTSYDKIGRFVSKWLEKVPESKIQTSSKDVKDEIKGIVLLNEGERLVSSDIVQLYTYVPLAQSIEIAAMKLYEQTDEVPVDLNTFIKLTRLACSNILIKAPNGYIRQIKGLAMDIYPAPQLANI